MGVRLMAGNGRKLAPHPHVREEAGEYLIELDVSDFAESELTVEALGPVIDVRLDERRDESFRLPDDADVAGIRVVYEHGKLDIHAPRARLEPRRLPIEHPAFAVNPDATAC
jgi:HSP20 family molecular chaperone IbpA